MAINQESFNDKLYDLLKIRGYDPIPKDSQNKRTTPKKADVFNFTFKKNGKDYGDAWVTIDDASNIIVYYDENQYNSPEGKTPGLDYDDSWTGFLKHLKNWAMKRQLTFELAPKDRLGDHMAKREETKKEELSEGYYPINKMSSYSDNVPTIKIVLQHTRQIQETEQRFRNIAKIFLENENGERILAPTVRPGIARVYARHLAEGGLPYDDRWKHIGSLVEEYTKMAGFVRATKNNTFTESAQNLVDAGVNHYLSLRETLGKLTSNRGYSTYFETFTPPLMEDDSEVANLNELFVQETLDPRIENVMPILTKLQKQINEVSEVKELENWADNIISEKMDSTTKSLAVPATDMLDESEERPYVCVHAKKGKFECKAKTSYEAVKKAADHWKLKSTAGIDAYLTDVKHTPVNEAPGAETLAHNQNTEKSNLKAFDLDESEIDDAEEAHKKIKTPAIFRKQKGNDWKVTGQDIEKAKARTGTTPEGLKAIIKLAGIDEGHDEQFEEEKMHEMFGKFFGKSKSKSVDEIPGSAKQKDPKSIAWEKAKKEIDSIEQQKLINRTGLKKVGTTTMKPTGKTSTAAQGKATELDWTLKEGYTVTRGVDTERYAERSGLEGPFMTKSGKVVYYDKVEGKYYDPDTDMYIEYDDYQKMNEEVVAEGYSLKKTNVDKYMKPGDPDEYTQDINIKDTDYEIINNKTGQVVGTASWTTNDFMGPGALKITMKNGATRYLDIWDSEKGNPQSAFNRFVKDPKTAKKYKDQGVAEGSKDSIPKMGKQERKLAQGALKGAKDMSAAFGLVRDKDGVLRIPKDKKQGVAEGAASDELARLEYDVRTLLANGDDYTAKKVAAGADTAADRNYLRKIIRQEMYNGEQGVAEDLDANQKRVGQLGPTEKVGPKGAVGKLVGANENFINMAPQAVAETGVTDYNPKSQGGTRKELLDKYHKSKDPKDAEAARKAGATQKELQNVLEGQDELNDIKRLLGK